MTEAPIVYGSKWMALGAMKSDRLALCREVAGKRYTSGLYLGKPGYNVAVCWIDQLNADLVDYKHGSVWPMIRGGRFGFAPDAVNIPDTSDSIHA